ncbi:hypothetical protein Tco_0733666, partial [Tanacetum coccineum]
MKCVTTSSFSISVNGESHRFFKGGRGLRQDTSSIKVIKDTMEEFSRCSGLIPNIQKSTVLFGSMNEEAQQKILDIMPFVKGKLPMRYLGVPLITKRLGVKDCK